mmetsp:Transcript_9840/g.13865  ORF Transcript_9840/g.13865 Transcript_9840/m.13865 type:complete len:146 (+) Transcript_9840:456-893(+)
MPVIDAIHDLCSFQKKMFLQHSKTYSTPNNNKGKKIHPMTELRVHTQNRKQCNESQKKQYNRGHFATPTLTVAKKSAAVAGCVVKFRPEPDSRREQRSVSKLSSRIILSSLTIDGGQRPLSLHRRKRSISGNCDDDWNVVEKTVC